MPVYGTHSANIVQMAAETTPGTGVAADFIWRGQVTSIEDTRQRVTVEEQVGTVVNPERIYDAWLGAQLALPQTELTYEQVPHIFEASIMTATPTGAGPYVYTYTLDPSNLPNTITTYTIETGNKLISNDHEEINYGFVEEFNLTGAAQQAWMMSSTWMGQTPVPTTLTPALTLVAVEEAIFGNTLVYIDDEGGTMGGTQLTGVLMGFDLRYRTGWQPVPVGDGTNYYTGIKFTQPEGTFTLTFELEDTSVVENERAKFSAKAVRLIRLNCPGSGGRDFTLDIAAQYDSIGSYTSTNGNTTVQFNGHVVYSTTAAHYMEAVVTNNLTTLP